VGGAPSRHCRARAAPRPRSRSAAQSLERASYLDLSDTIPTLVDALDSPAPGEEAAAAADEEARRSALAAARAAEQERAAAAVAAATAAAEAAAAARARPDWHPLAGAPGPPPSPPAAPPAGAPPRRPQDCFSLFGEEEDRPGSSPPAHLDMQPLPASLAALEDDEEGSPTVAQVPPLPPPPPEFDSPATFDDPLRAAAAASAAAPPPAPAAPAPSPERAFGASLMGRELAADAARRAAAGPRPPPPKRRCRRADVALRELLKVLAGRPEERYDARCRVALRRLARHLRCSKADVTALEAELGGGALAQASLWPRLVAGEAEGGGGTAWLQAPMEAARADPDGGSALDAAASRRTYKVYAAAAAGAGLLALTGGLAAPAIIAGAAAMLPGAALAGAGGVAAGAAITGGLSVAGGSIAARSMANRTAALREFSFAPIVNDADGEPAVTHARMALTLCVSGWLSEAEDFTRPWEPLSAVDAERVGVVWESDELLSLGTAMKAAVTDVGMAEVVKHGAMHTALQGLLSAVALPATMLTAASLIDNSWARCCDRADQAALLLAAALLEGAWYSRRPVTLLGYSLGARVVFGALQRLADAGAAGVVETLVLFGAPLPSDPAEWERVRQVVAGRLINVYSEHDWLLSLAYRSHALSSAAAGLRPVAAEGVENVDAGAIIKRHTRYPKELPALLRHISTSHLAVPPRTKTPANMVRCDAIDAAVMRFAHALTRGAPGLHVAGACLALGIGRGVP